MADISKARLFLNKCNSDIQELQSFPLMLATAEERYRRIKLNQKGNKFEERSLDAKEIQAALEYAGLFYLKKFGKLPPNVGLAFKQGISLKEKYKFAQEWADARK